MWTISPLFINNVTNVWVPKCSTLPIWMGSKITRIVYVACFIGSEEPCSSHHSIPFDIFGCFIIIVVSFPTLALSDRCNDECIGAVIADCWYFRLVIGWNLYDKYRCVILPKSNQPAYTPYSYSTYSLYLCTKVNKSLSFYFLFMKMPFKVIFEHLPVWI